MGKLQKLIDYALLSVVAYYAIISPFTKVEESFGLQAIHDILNYGIGKDSILNNYDHIKFSGAVPRTFVGNLLIAAFVKAFDSVKAIVGSSFVNKGIQLDLQIATRAVIGLLNVKGLLRLKESLNTITLSDRRSRVKGLTGFWFVFLLISQFHILYYSSRTLPNFIALPFVNFALSRILEGDVSGLAWLGFTGIVFRLEVGFLGGCIAISSALFGQSNLVVNMIVLCGGVFLGTLMSFPIDSYFWNYYLIPEIASFKFNVLDGKSANWGIEPWNAYFVKYLQQLFKPPVVLLLTLPGLIKDPAKDYISNSPGAVNHPARHSIRILVVGAVLYIIGMSFQPHKEWRFIIYTAPIFTCSAANALANINTKWALSFSNKLLLLIVLCLTVTGTLLSLFMGYVSSFNYPGGDAILYVNEYIRENTTNIHTLVHMDVASCMTGISRFLETHDATITYDKTEQLTDLKSIWNDIDIVITESVIDRPLKTDNTVYPSAEWEELATFKKFESVTLYPIIKIIQNRHLDHIDVNKLLGKVLLKLNRMEFETIKEFLNSFVKTSNYLYVYKRKSESDLEKTFLDLSL